MSPHCKELLLFNLRDVATILLVIFIGTATVWLTATHATDVVPGKPTISTVLIEPQEDEPGFDCHIHGNRTCGPASLTAS